MANKQIHNIILQLHERISRCEHLATTLQDDNGDLIRNPTQDHVKDTDICTICSESLKSQTNPELVFLPCHSVFHKDCLEKWIEICLTARNRCTCPDCRAYIPDHLIPNHGHGGYQIQTLPLTDRMVYNNIINVLHMFSRQHTDITVSEPVYIQHGQEVLIHITRHNTPRRIAILLQGMLNKTFIFIDEQNNQRMLQHFVALNWRLVLTNSLQWLRGEVNNAFVGNFENFV